MTIHRPKDVQERLGISASALRLWSDNFGELLSPAAQRSTTESGGAAQRRYTDEDLDLLLRAKALIDQNKTYEETKELLRRGGHIPVPAAAGPRQRNDADMQASMDHPAMVAFQKALEAKDETIATLHKTIEAKDQTIEALRNGKEDVAELGQRASSMAADYDKTMDSIIEKLEFLLGVHASQQQQQPQPATAIATNNADDDEENDEEPKGGILRTIGRWFVKPKEK